MEAKDAKLINAYIREVKMLLPIRGGEEKAFLADLRSDLCDYFEEFPGSLRADIEKKFGSPQSIVRDYISAVDYARLQRRLRIVRYIKIACIIIVALAIFVEGIGEYYYNRLVDAAEKSQTTYVGCYEE